MPCQFCEEWTENPAWINLGTQPPFLGDSACTVDAAGNCRVAHCSPLCPQGWQATHTKPQIRLLPADPIEFVTRLAQSHARPRQTLPSPAWSRATASSRAGGLCWTPSAGSQRSFVSSALHCTMFCLWGGLQEPRRQSIGGFGPAERPPAESMPKRQALDLRVRGTEPYKARLEEAWAHLSSIRLISRCISRVNVGSRARRTTNARRTSRPLSPRASPEGSRRWHCLRCRNS